jgi:hypothetical protein
VVEKMMTTMMDHMAARMSKEDIQAMMVEMMSQMFAGMDLADRVAFMQAMMGVCIPKITEGLDACERERLAASILGQMAEEIKQTSGAAEP